MSRFTTSFVCRATLAAALLPVAGARASDPVLEWNATMRALIQQEGSNAQNNANPGWSTRALAMANTAIYDVYQAFDRTNRPFLSKVAAPAGASLDAAVNEAAYRTLMECYLSPSEQSMLTSYYNTRMATIPDGQGKIDGIALGQSIGEQCIVARTGDGALLGDSYTPGVGPGAWRPDPYNRTQQAWGPAWGGVKEFAIGDTQPFIDALPPLPALTSQAYADAFNQVKEYGGVTSTMRSDDQTNIGLFWAYDRATMGPPPVLFNRNVAEIAAQVGNAAEDNARLFAMVSVAMADAATAAWDAKFKYNLWRPVTGIQEADTDGNPSTVADPTWRPLGAPGNDPHSEHDDFTPPFPAWTSGHATMGSATFAMLHLFYGTNNFDEIDGVDGNNPEFTLTSEEYDVNGVAGMTRSYGTFTETASLVLGSEVSPEGENATSRVYLGVHWIMDQEDGMTLGRNIAAFVNENFFQAVPEPSGMALAAIAAVGLAAARRRRRVA